MQSPLPNQLPVELVGISLPRDLVILSAERNTIGETNTVFYCRALFGGREVAAYIKVGRDSSANLKHERDIIERIASTDIPVPRLLGYSSAPRESLILEELPGSLIWDYIDPRRKLYDRDLSLPHLVAYGECLGRIHSLPAEGPAHKRPRLYRLIDEGHIPDERFQRLVSWLTRHTPENTSQTFVHGDLNTASVLVHEGRVSGVIDWEFAGLGWREYDLAWLLRARTAFLGTAEEREAVLQGYGRVASYDAEALRYCEVLNYLHFAGWCGTSEPEYTEFALRKAETLVRGC
jgi:aminoglycoside phosphotransferase (APT) family kinase protein